jgi:hypothetical protein
MDSDKRYQIFISSTYEDLKAEREAVQRVILKKGHFPVGMELFHASELSSWDIITRFIDDSDYYVLIIGERYGSGMTEKEYDYAVNTGKPVISFLCKNYHSGPFWKCSPQEEQAKVEAFRKKVNISGRQRSEWSDAGELATEVLLGIDGLIKNFKAVGWVRADSQTIDGSKHSEDIKEIEPEEIIDIPLKIKELKEINITLGYNYKPLTLEDPFTSSTLTISLFYCLNKFKHFLISNKKEEVIINQFRKIFNSSINNNYRRDIDFTDESLYKLLWEFKKNNILSEVYNDNSWGLTSLGKQIVSSLPELPFNIPDYPLL